MMIGESLPNHQSPISRCPDVQPLRLDPILKRIRWGGRRLGDVLGKPLGPETDYAESWEVADHGRDQSVVSDGPFAGWTLKRLVAEQNQPLLGEHAGLDQFPLLVKFLDANDNLSVQVHPNDELAVQFDRTENGKTEAWVIVDAEPDSELFVGLKAGVTASDLRRATRSGVVEALLNRFAVKPGDCVFVPAGTVHAIGGGVLLAEIQQSSDLTFRLDDWGRVGADGRPRPLHVEQALQCIDFERGPVFPVTPTRIGDHPLQEELVRSEHFVMRRHRSASPFSFAADDRCHVLMVLDGSGLLQTGAETIPLPRGQTVLLPADRPALTIEPDQDTTLLDAFLP